MDTIDPRRGRPTRVAVLAMALGCACGGDGAGPPAGQEAKAPLGSVLGLLPTGVLKVSLMGPSNPEELVPLMAKVQQAAQEDPEWFASHAKSAPEGELLPYDPRLGVTESEYAELLELLSGIRMVEIAKASLTVSSPAPSVFRLGARDPIAELDGIEIDVASGTVHTPFGTLTESAEVLPTEDQTATGPWRGTEWTLEEGDLEGELADLTATQVTFGLGRFVERREGLLLYKVRKFEASRKTASVTLLITYPVDASD